MSQKLILVKYKLEGGVAIDESSENLQSTYAPDEFINWMSENNRTSDLLLREVAGGAADISIISIDEDKEGCLETIFSYIETQLISHIERAYRHFSNNVVDSQELDGDFRTLHIWLSVRLLLKEKMERYQDRPDIKLVIG